MCLGALRGALIQPYAEQRAACERTAPGAVTWRVAQQARRACEAAPRGAQGTAEEELVQVTSHVVRAWTAPRLQAPRARAGAAGPARTSPAAAPAPAAAAAAAAPGDGSGTREAGREAEKRGLRNRILSRVRRVDIAALPGARAGAPHQPPRDAPGPAAGTAPGWGAWDAVRAARPEPAWGAPAAVDPGRRACTDTGVAAECDSGPASVLLPSLWLGAGAGAAGCAGEAGLEACGAALRAGKGTAGAASDAVGAEEHCSARAATAARQSAAAGPGTGASGPAGSGAAAAGLLPARAARDSASASACSPPLPAVAGSGAEPPLPEVLAQRPAAAEPVHPGALGAPGACRQRAPPHGCSGDAAALPRACAAPHHNLRAPGASAPGASAPAAGRSAPAHPACCMRPRARGGGPTGAAPRLRMRVRFAD